MKRLNLFEHIEAKVSNRRVPKRIRHFSVVPYDSDEPTSTSTFTAMSVVDYRVNVGARVIVDNNGPAIEEGKLKVARMLARHMFADIKEELIDLEEWIYQEGIGKDVGERVCRLIKLVSGDSVEDMDIEQ